MYFVCCKILGVAPGADEETIRAAYRKSAKELHPDVNDSDKASEYFIILKNAYEYLLEHRYSDAELEILWHQEQVKNSKLKRKTPEEEKQYFRKRRVENLSLQQILKQSRLARTIYLSFHVLFIFVGIWMLVHSVYDMIAHEPKEGVDPFSAYFTIVFGFFMGVTFTATFLFTGISYLRNK